MRVLIHRDELFLPSETFVWQRDNYPENTEVTFSGLRLHGGMPSGPAITAVPTRLGGFGRAAYRLVGMSKATFQRQLRDAAVVHAHFALDAASLLPSMSVTKRPLIVSLHGFDVLASDDALRRLGLRGRLFLQRRHQLLKKARLFLCSSKFLMSRAIEVGYPADRLRLHYIGVPLDYLSKLGSVFTEPSVPTLVFAGRLVENKGADLLPGLSRYLRQRGIPHFLKIIGQGPLRQRIEEQITTDALPIALLGPQPQHQLHQAVAASTLVLVPSRPISTGESEALNLVALEATAIGVPVVANATGGLPEVVSHGMTGLLADPRNGENFYECVERLLIDDRLRHSLRATIPDLSAFERGTARRRLLAHYESVQ
jgi:colanic acid/amylovoran biosynthesis glycosyltransferase